MKFTHRIWTEFCAALAERGVYSIPAADVLAGRAQRSWLVLKHDVETDVPKAFQMARIEHAHGHRGSYYVQAYLLNDAKNVSLLREMAQMGHEISYHYDVMDSSKGDLDRAMAEFADHVQRFERSGFVLTTLCQHGNPVVERVGYHSNRDFFRSERVQERYPELADIMVDFKRKADTDYLYFSDAGRRFHLIYDPINNDIENSEDKNIVCQDLGQVMGLIGAEQNAIVSVHPHRWCASAMAYDLKTGAFKAIRFTAKQAMKVPLFKKIMGRFYYLAKKI